ncbi:MAG: hypothetical protein P8R42_04695 [Candidatus Binatia bacterium]|nr:hypothetical protein [Candidatus Binatia bacterium]
MGFNRTNFTQGGVNLFRETSGSRKGLHEAFNAGREGFYGWMGLGGSIFQWHPRLDIGFSFVPTSLHVLGFFTARGKIYQAEALGCAERLRS